MKLTGRFAILILLAITWRIWTDYSKNRKDFTTTDLSNPKRFSFVTTGGSFERVVVTMNGKFEGTLKMGFFYGGEKQKASLKNLTVMTFRDSINIKWPYEEGKGAKHEFFLMPVNAKNGFINIKIRNSDS